MFFSQYKENISSWYYSVEIRCVLGEGGWHNLLPSQRTYREIFSVTENDAAFLWDRMYDGVPDICSTHWHKQKLPLGLNFPHITFLRTWHSFQFTLSSVFICHFPLKSLSLHHSLYSLCFSSPDAFKTLRISHTAEEEVCARSVLCLPLSDYIQEFLNRRWWPHIWLQQLPDIVNQLDLYCCLCQRIFQVPLTTYINSSNQQHYDFGCLQG